MPEPLFNEVAGLSVNLYLKRALGQKQLTTLAKTLHLQCLETLESFEGGGVYRKFKSE